jgi:hypothetical protein
MCIGGIFANTFYTELKVSKVVPAGNDNRKHGTKVV